MHRVFSRLVLVTLAIIVSSTGAGEARALPGTADAVHPFWSPDGSKLAFFSEDEFRQIDIKSGEVKTLVTGAGFPVGGSSTEGRNVSFTARGISITRRTYGQT